VALTKHSDHDLFNDLRLSGDHAAQFPLRVFDQLPVARSAVRQSLLSRDLNLRYFPIRFPFMKPFLCVVQHDGFSQCGAGFGSRAQLFNVANELLNQLESSRG